MSGVAQVMVLTDRRMASTDGRDVVDVAAAAVGSGAAAILLREKDLSRPERHHLAARLHAVTDAAGASLVVAGDVDLALAVGAVGVHLAATDEQPDFAKLGRPLRVGRSCHSIAELEAAIDHADYVTFSPVYATVSKPGYGPALGVDGLALGCRAVARPGCGLAVCALGGIEPGRAAACVAAGAQGVALMGAVMRATDPGAVVHAVVDEVTSAEPAAGLADA